MSVYIHMNSANTGAQSTVCLMLQVNKKCEWEKEKHLYAWKDKQQIVSFFSFVFFILARALCGRQSITPTAIEWPIQSVISSLNQILLRWGGSSRQATRGKCDEEEEEEKKEAGRMRGREGKVKLMHLAIRCIEAWSRRRERKKKKEKFLHQ